MVFAVSAFAFAGPASANIYVELSFQGKMDQSDLVVIGTVTATEQRVSDRFAATASVHVLYMLKGAPQSDIVVHTQSAIAEADPRCCEVGATYIMFLRRAPDGSGLYSTNGSFGMIRTGPAHNEPELRVVPGEPLERR